MPFLSFLIMEMEMYKTSDLYLSAYLKAKGHRVRCEHGKKCTFVFLSNVSHDVNEFFNDGLIGVTLFKNAVQDLKTMLYNTED